jgi:hypothetical protein
MKLKKIALLLFFVFSPLAAVIIDREGDFTLGGNYVIPGTDVITIQANNVDLNLNGKIVAGGLNGIKVKSGFSNIRIRNGFIAQVTNSGISIEDNCNAVEISDIGIAQCGGRAIEIVGTGPSALVKNVAIYDVTCNACCLSPLSSQVFLVQYGNNVVMRGSAILSSGNTTNAIDVVRFENSSDCLLQSVLLKSNFGAGLTGCTLDASDACFFANVDFSTGLALSQTFTGFKLTNSSSANGFSVCRVVSCTALAGDATGLEISEGSISNVFSEVNIGGIEGNSVYGFHISGVGTPSNTNNNLFGDCAVVSCKARSGDAIGFFVSRADDSAIGRSQFLGQRAPNGIAAGIRFASGTGGDNWSLIDNRIARNLGSSDANSYGMFMETGTSNIFVLNRAFDNGATAANQYSGVPAGSISLVNASSINTVSAPWTNIGITP